MRIFFRQPMDIKVKIQSLLNSRTFFHLTVGESTLDIEQALDSRKLLIFNLAKGKLGSETSEAFEGGAGAGAPLHRRVPELHRSQHRGDSVASSWR